jgi:hypothetical protein
MVSFKCLWHSLHVRTQITMYNYTRRIPLAFCLPLLTPLCLPLAPHSTPFYLLGTLLAVTGSVRLGLRLLVNWPPLSHPFPKPSPLQIPRTPATQRLTKTTSGRIRRLLSGTITSIHRALVYLYWQCSPHWSVYTDSGFGLWYQQHSGKWQIYKDSAQILGLLIPQCSRH